MNTGSKQAAGTAWQDGGQPVDVRPLYARIRDIIAERIRARQWAPGALLPNEFEIAADLGVSQGTVRKALNQLADEKLVVRHQGRGTFVVEHTPENVLFRFFNIVDDAGHGVEPETTQSDVRLGKAGRIEATRLAIPVRDDVVRIDRVRSLSGVPAIRERIVLPGAMFPGILGDLPLPNTLYDYFQRRHAMTIASGEENIVAAAADADDVSALGVARGTPLLCLDRIMRALGGEIVEWRVSRCHLTGTHYRVRLG